MGAMGCVVKFEVEVWMMQRTSAPSNLKSRLNYLWMQQLRQARAWTCARNTTFNGFVTFLHFDLLMPPALDRLLASRLLRSFVNGHARRCYADDARPGLKWRRWREREIPNRDRVRRFLEGDDKVLFEGGERRVNGEREHVEYTKTASTSHSTGDTATNDAAQWASSLFRHGRLHNQKRIMALWNSRRHAGASLPTDDSLRAENLWGTFIKHPDLVTDVIDHAAELLRETGKVHLRLYELLMSYWLPRDHVRALKYHGLMLEKLQLKTLPLGKLALYGASTFKPAAYDVLYEIYWASTEQDVYDDIVPALVEKSNIDMARRWHTLCTSRGDMPSESVADHPVIHMFAAETAAAERNEPFSRDAIRKDRKYNKTLLRRLLGRDTPSVRFDDAFTARMFATRTFPTESVIKGLAMVGVNEMGPQAVLAMALRTDPLEDLPRMFDELRASGIALQGCVYSLAIEKFAASRNWPLVRSMLDSDQHPDVFGDADVQRKLLDFYLDQNDHVQVQRTLAILTLFHNQFSQESWNILLQTHIKRTGPQHVTEVLQSMRTRGVMVSSESIMAIKTLLRRRVVGHRPTTIPGHYDDLRFVTRVSTSILEFGMGAISPPYWREIIRRFGMTGRFKELRRLLLWLLSWYAPRSATQFSRLPSSPFRQPAFDKLRKLHPEGGRYFHFPPTTSQLSSKKHPIRLLFPPSLQQGLIIWGFRAGLIPHAPLEQSLLPSPLSKKHYRVMLLRRHILQRKRWSIGLRTLVLLRDLGLHVHQHTVVKACQMQFKVLFGRGRSRRTENRIMEDVNEMPYAAYVREVNDLWGTGLFSVPARDWGALVQDRMWHPRMRRVVDRRPSVSIRDVLGPEWKERLVGSSSSEREGDLDMEGVGSHDHDAAYLNLQQTFVAQGRAGVPGSEWMYAQDLSTQDVGKRVGRVRRKRVVRSVAAKRGHEGEV